jgi:hypothetical protein
MPTVPDTSAPVQPHLEDDLDWFDLDAEFAADLAEIALSDADELDGIGLTLADWLDCQAGYYLQVGTPAARFLAEEIRMLGVEARGLCATTIDAFTDRRQAMEKSYRDELLSRGEARGYQRAKDSHQLNLRTYGHCSLF